MLLENVKVLKVFFLTIFVVLLQLQREPGRRTTCWNKPWIFVSICFFVSKRCTYAICWKKKRFYTRGTLTSRRFLDWLESKPFIVIGRDPWSKKRANYLSCIEGKGVVKTITVVHKIPRYLFIYYKISFVNY